jgi:Subtilase family
VMIGLDVNASLDQLSRNRAGVQAATDAKARAIITELGEQAWTTGYWSSGIGQIGLYVTPQGLNILQKSRNARMFEGDRTSIMRGKTFDPDGRLDAIEEQINKTGSAEVDITFNLKHLDYSIAADGSLNHRISALASEELRERVGKFAQDMSARLSPDHAALKAQVEQAKQLALQAQATSSAGAASQAKASADPGFGLHPRMRMRLTREGFYAMQEHHDVLSIVPVGWMSSRPAKIDPQALEHARKHGWARVILSFGGHEAYSTRQSDMSAAAQKVQHQALSRVMEDWRRNAADGMKNHSDLSHFGILIADMSAAALERLISSNDPRLHRLDLDRVAAKPDLSSTTSFINMPAAWNATPTQFRGAGQNIVIFDSGVRRTHNMMQKNGVSKVAFEACFGTDDPATGLQSVCPQKNASGDSPLGLVGSASAPCTSQSIWCSHGTHVAGIAAGSTVQHQGVSFSGVAPDANIVAVQIMSFNSSFDASAFTSDIILGLNTLATQTTTDNYVANISASAGAYSNCLDERGSIQVILRTLLDRGIPVVASTGNNSYNSTPAFNPPRQMAIGWPACERHIIKVANLQVNANGTVQLAPSSNILPDAPRPFLDSVNPLGRTIFLAPGQRSIPGEGHSVFSAFAASDSAYDYLAGTSMAAPHVAGFLAVLKAAFPGITVLGAVNWIRDNGSVATPLNLGGTIYNFKRIRVP